MTVRTPKFFVAGALLAGWSSLPPRPRPFTDAAFNPSTFVPATGCCTHPQ
jgi:hypothetical protein